MARFTTTTGACPGFPVAFSRYTVASRSRPVFWARNNGVPPPITESRKLTGALRAAPRPTGRCAWTHRYLLCNHLLNPPSAKPRQKFEATSRFIRDLVAHRWARRGAPARRPNPKRIHYLSMEFLLGRTLRNNMMNLAAEPIVRRAMEQRRLGSSSS
jgi:hypothetical protein